MAAEKSILPQGFHPRVRDRAGDLPNLGRTDLPNRLPNDLPKTITQPWS
jgi:hypothetical protein